MCSYRSIEKDTVPRSLFLEEFRMVREKRSGAVIESVNRNTPVLLRTESVIRVLYACASGWAGLWCRRQCGCDGRCRLGLSCDVCPFPPHLYQSRWDVSETSARRQR